MLSAGKKMSICIRIKVCHKQENVRIKEINN